MSKFDFDTDFLADYLIEHINGFTGPLQASKFSGGQSNPTFLLTTPERKYVLRRKPPGKLLKGAHAVDREFRVMSALANTTVPVAQTLHLCEDDEVIGSIFYVMEYLDGTVYWNPLLPECSTTQRTAIYDQMNQILADLHTLDPVQLGLRDYGRAGDYFARQTNTWTHQYRASELDHIKAMETLIDWLPNNLPAEDGRCSIVHGDYRLDNIMFSSAEPRALGVLDWELSTLGHPFADLAYQCMQYYIPAQAGLPGLANQDLASLGIPDEAEYRTRYCKRINIKFIDNWNFYLSFSLFRLAAICQGVYKRGKDGNASSDKARQYGQIVEPLAQIAVNLI